jgi:murein DD-endopeptidase MepM/ murein hydrolase activator NlpD
MKKTAWIAIGAAAGLAAAVALLWPSSKLENMLPAPTQQVVEEFAFGIPVTGRYVCSDKVVRNDNFSTLLSRHGVDNDMIQSMVRSAEGIFDLRKLVVGKDFTLIHAADGILQYMVYEQDPVHYVVFEMGDEPCVYKGQKELVTRQREAGGVINSSLWDALNGADVDPNMAVELSEVFAWSVDFYHLQKGDYFRIIFDQDYAGEVPVGRRIKAAYMRHRGQDLYAIGFEQDGVLSFYDENGKSCRKAFLQAPLKYSRISSGYTNKRFHPILKRYTAHPGIDYAAPMGTPIYAVGDGTILNAEYKGGNGNYVKIKHNETYTTQYLHMSKFGPGIKAGARVKQGDVIGYVGSTGLSTGPHLCYRFWKNGEQVDPFKEMMPPSEPIKEESAAAFAKVRDRVKAQLDNIELDHDASGAEAAE